MNYPEVIKYLERFLNCEKTGYKGKNVFNLGRIEMLSKLFNNPHNTFHSIHIAGTKGKGSIASFISSILTEAGYRTGLYTSPHLVTPRERIRINREMIGEEEFAGILEDFRSKYENADLDFAPTFFEVMTVLAFYYFYRKKIDIGVIEAGLGGRLDATNIIDPILCVISPISYDHMHILGKSLKEITFEKTGIIKKGSICVSSGQEGEVLEIISERCNSLGVELVVVGRDVVFNSVEYNVEREIFKVDGMLRAYNNLESSLLGVHQLANAATAVAAAEVLIRKGFNISSDDIRDGLYKAENPGRCEIVSENPLIILDGAQNRASARAIKDTIKRNMFFKRIILILGISKDKDIEGVCSELVSASDVIILTKSKVKRAAEPDVIKLSAERFCRDRERIIVTRKTVEEAIAYAISISTSHDVILITGSLFLVGEAKEYFFKNGNIRL